MKLTSVGMAGTLESGDISVEIQGRESGGVEIDLESTVANQFGRQIKEVITQTLAEYGIGHAAVRAVDKGALDCTVRARTTAAIYRGAGQDDYKF